MIDDYVVCSFVLTNDDWRMEDGGWDGLFIAHFLFIPFHVCMMGYPFD